MYKRIIKQIFLTQIFILASITSLAQSDYTHIPMSSKPTFSDALKGIRSYNISLISNGELLRNRRTYAIDTYFVSQIESWLSAIIPDADFGVNYNYPLLSYAGVVASYSYYRTMKSNGVTVWCVSNVSITFVLGGYVEKPTIYYSFNIPSFNVEGYFTDNKLRRLLMTHIDEYTHRYDPVYTMKLPKYMTTWKMSNLKPYLDSNKDELEGIYELTNPDGDNKYVLAVKKMPSGHYDLIYLYGANHFDDWSEGEIKALLNPTGSSSTFKAEYLMNDKSLNKDCYVIFYNGGKFGIRVDGTFYVYQKIYPISGYPSTNRNTFGQ